MRSSGREIFVWSRVVYCHRHLLAEELRKSYLGLAALPPRDSSPAADASFDIEAGAAPGGSSRIAFGKAIDIRPSVAMRKVSARKRGSKIVRLVDPFRKREIQAESGLEEAVALILIARSDLREIREQQRPDVAASSKARRYFVDFLTVDRDGRKVAYEVKYAQDVEAATKERLEILARDAGDSFAAEFRLVTEKDLSAVAIENARLIVDCGSDADLDAQDVVRDSVVGQGGHTTARRIGVETGLGARGVRAAFALIQSGLFKPARGAPLDQDTVLAIGRDPRAS
jgi:hypothetical protein